MLPISDPRFENDIIVIKFNESVTSVMASLSSIVVTIQGIEFEIKWLIKFVGPAS